MGKIYKNQTALKLRATVGVDVTGATSALIKYRKPGGDTGSFAADITNAEAGALEYVVASPEDLDEKGVWTFWGHVTFSVGKAAPGEIYQLRVHGEGS